MLPNLSESKTPAHSKHGLKMCDINHNRYSSLYTNINIWWEPNFTRVLHLFKLYPHLTNNLNWFNFFNDVYYSNMLMKYIVLSQIKWIIRICIYALAYVARVFSACSVHFNSCYKNIWLTPLADHLTCFTVFLNSFGTFFETVLTFSKLWEQILQLFA